jgi:hypothetical protein
MSIAQDHVYHRRAATKNERNDKLPPPITDAGPLFDATRARRVDVRRALRALLADSLPIFEVPHPGVSPVGDTKDGLPIVVLAESGELLCRLLFSC